MAALASACGHEPPQAAGETDRGPQSRGRVLETAQHRLHVQGEAAVGCEGCHEQLAGEYLKAKSYRCLECHADAPLSLHDAARDGSEARECWSCHDFSATELAPTPCAACHERALGSLAAITPHDPDQPLEDCGDCHRAHQEPSLASTPCESCHDDETVTGHDKPEIQITGCASCHGYHEDPATAADRCTGCHRQSRAHVPQSATFEGHDACVTCHQPHRFFASEVVSCSESCHQDVTVLAQHRVAKHRDCRSCHDQHEVKASAPKACERCHAGKAIGHPKDADSGTRCLGCHQPHGPKAARRTRACTDCHRIARSDVDLHHGPGGTGPSCTACHKPHDFVFEDAGVPLCRQCHGAKPFPGAATVRTHEQHGDCFRCHGESVAHQPGSEPIACRSCHSDQASAAHGGHKACAQCHEPHSTALKKRCDSCHQVQARTAPDNHKPCRTCHAPHSAQVLNTCAECHRDRARGIHEGVQGGCQTCHRPHGPQGPAAPPRCTACHDPAGLPVLHQVAEHRHCDRCHRSHGEQPYRRRSACVGCHRAQWQHEPKAKMCTGCHMFLEGR